MKQLKRAGMSTNDSLFFNLSYVAEYPETVQ